MAESKELEDFVRSACVGIQKGVAEGLEIKFPIEFEVAVVVQKETKGMFRLLVVSDLDKYAKNEISRIKFKIGKQEAEISRIRFKIGKQEADSGRIRFYRE